MNSNIWAVRTVNGNCPPPPPPPPKMTSDHHNCRIPIIFNLYVSWTNHIPGFLDYYKTVASSKDGKFLNIQPFSTIIWCNMSTGRQWASQSLNHDTINMKMGYDSKLVYYFKTMPHWGRFSLPNCYHREKLYRDYSSHHGWKMAFGG